MFVANDLHSHITLLFTAESTVERNRTNVTCVTRPLVSLEVSRVTWHTTLETNLTCVQCATKASATKATWTHISDVFTATEDHISVLTVACNSVQTVIWSVMFAFTLVQSRTHADPVQAVLHHILNSSNIFWSPTLKVLMLYIKFVGRSSAIMLD